MIISSSLQSPAPLWMLVAKLSFSARFSIRSGPRRGMIVRRAYYHGVRDGLRRFSRRRLHQATSYEPRSIFLGWRRGCLVRALRMGLRSRRKAHDDPFPRLTDGAAVMSAAATWRVLSFLGNITASLMVNLLIIGITFHHLKPALGASHRATPFGPRVNMAAPLDPNLLAGLLGIVHDIQSVRYAQGECPVSLFCPD